MGHNILTKGTIPHKHKWNLSMHISQNTNERCDIFFSLVILLWLTSVKNYNYCNYDS